MLQYNAKVNVTIHESCQNGWNFHAKIFRMQHWVNAAAYTQLSVCTCNKQKVNEMTVWLINLDSLILARRLIFFHAVCFSPRSSFASRSTLCFFFHTLRYHRKCKHVLIGEILDLSWLDLNSEWFMVRTYTIDFTHWF